MAIQLQGTTPNLQGAGTSLQGNTTSLQGSSLASMGVQTPSPQVKTSAPPPITSNVTDLSSKYASVAGANGAPATIYNKSTGQGYSDPSSFFKDAGVNSFNNLKFDTSWTPPTSTLGGLQMPGSTSNQSNSGSGLLASGSTGAGLLGSQSKTPATPSTTSPTNSAGLTTSQNPSDTSSAYPNAYTGTQSSNPTYATLSNQAQQLSTPSQQEINLANQIAQFKNTTTQAETGTSTVGDLEGATGRQNAINQSAQSTLQSLSDQLTNLQNQRTAALKGVQDQIQTLAPVSAGPGTTLINPATGSTIASTNQLTTNIAGAPTSFNPSTGLIGQGTTGGGILGTPTSSSDPVQSAVTSVLTSLGANDPATTSFITSAVQQAIANGGNVPTSLTASQANVVKQVLSQMSGGSYSSQNAAINQSNLAAQSASAQAVAPIANTALANLQSLQKLSDTVGYSNSPITNDIRNAFSNTFVVDPNITTLQSALQFVTGEVSQVLGGGDSTVAALNSAATGLQAGRIDPATLKSVISNAVTMVNNRLQQLQSPASTVTLPTGLPGSSSSQPSGLQMPSGNASSLDLTL